MKLLIDECLSPTLVKVAQDAGFGESTHVNYLGLAGTKDWKLKDIILEGDWTFVTRNSIDFRGSRASPGSKGQYAGVELHAGLVCLNLPDHSTRADQIELFEAALAALGDPADLMNEVIEVSLDGAEIILERYLMPK